MESIQALFNPNRDEEFTAQQTLLLIGLAGLATLLIAFTPWLSLLDYPFRLLVTLVHELGHGLAALLTGGRFIRFVIFPNGSGLAYTAGGWRFVVIPAGYVGVAVFGAGLILLGRSHRWSRIAMSVIGGAMILLSLRYGLPSIFSFQILSGILTTVSGVIFGALFLWVAVKAAPGWIIFLLHWVAIQAGLTAFSDIATVDWPVHAFFQCAGQRCGIDGRADLYPGDCVGPGLGYRCGGADRRSNLANLAGPGQGNRGAGVANLQGRRCYFATLHCRHTLPTILNLCQDRVGGVTSTIGLPDTLAVDDPANLVGEPFAIERFAQEAVKPGVLSFGHFRAGISSRDSHHRDIFQFGLIFKPLQDLVAVAIRQSQIQKDNIDFWNALGSIDHGAGITLHGCPHAQSAQHDRNNGQARSIIFND